MSEDLISVIVPCYCVQNYVEKCLESILANTYKNLEIICVDDASTDNTGAILDEYAKKDSRIHVIHSAKNNGLSVARNIGLFQSKGQYISFVDSDDVISPSFYQMLHQYMEPSHCIVQCQLAEFNDGSTPSYKAICKKKYVGNSIPESVRAIQMFKMETVLQMNKLYSRDIFFDDQRLSVQYPAWMLHEDEYLIIDELTRCNRFVALKDDLYGYRRNRTGSITNTMTLDRVKGMVNARTHAAAVLKIKRDKYCHTGLECQRFQEVEEFETETLLNDFMYMWLKLNKEDQKNGSEIFQKVKTFYKGVPANCKHIKYKVFFISPKLFKKLIKRKENTNVSNQV